jgi:hypothetical protein
VSERDLKEVRRADHARQLLENPVHQEAWDALRKRLLALMEAAKTDEATLKAKLALNLLTDLESHWLRIISNGAVAAESIKLEEAQKKWFRRAG